MPNLRLIAAAVTLASLAACSTTYTVDDGRQVDEKLLAQIRTYADGERALRPAIVRSADLHDQDCSHQWELPFDAYTTYPLKDDDAKVAWVRGAGIDEHLRVIATSAAADLAVGDILAEIDGYESKNAVKMQKELISDRDHGKPFDVKLESGRTVKITPVEVCRGHIVLGEPGKHADDQEYHWLAVHQPLQIAAAHLSPDEAQWVVLWTQGLSEEAGVRMRVWKTGVGLVTFAGEVALTVATAGAAAAAAAGATAAGAAAGASVGATLGAAATSMALVVLPREAASIAGYAVSNTASLHGINWVASTGFHKADKWAFAHMDKLGMNPAAGEALEKHLASAGSTRNAFLLDDEREKQMSTLLASLPAQTQPVQAKDENAPAPTLPAGSTAPVELSTAPGPVQAETVAAPIDDSSIHQAETIQ
ncbi:YgdI/YgdR family lipoprotein [Paraburkholderia sp. HP33-1]|uniref:YgdI/YgdR family lipoprotein n=1 Tax=Paraburkholderia sp. HP33-1 TaxID=2883243 RepID=UPI001F1F5A06|nr:YgdI/YgdR family lipoprotein [Paraburkholderia sp. HP33-1]